MPPPVLPDYRVERLLGGGGSGSVWLVRDGAGKPFALKVSGGGGASNAFELRREANVLARWDHPHLLRLHTVVETDQGVGLISTYAPGGSVAELVRVRGSVTPGEAVTVLVGTAAALAYLHAQGAAHGDVSPGNILFTPDGKPLLADFGQARLLGMPKEERLGTPGFEPPENASAATLNAAGDIFALAAVGWFLLTGKVPPEARNRPPLSILVPGLGRELPRLLEAGLEEDPDRRPTAEEFAAAAYRGAPALPVELAAAVRPEVLPELLTRRTRSAGDGGRKRRGNRSPGDLSQGDRARRRRGDRRENRWPVGGGWGRRGERLGNRGMEGIGRGTAGRGTPARPGGHWGFHPLRSAGNPLASGSGGRRRIRSAENPLVSGSGGRRRRGEGSRIRGGGGGQGSGREPSGRWLPAAVVLVAAVMVLAGIAVAAPGLLGADTGRPGAVRSAPAAPDSDSASSRPEPWLPAPILSAPALPSPALPTPVLPTAGDLPPGAAPPAGAAQGKDSQAGPTRDVNGRESGTPESAGSGPARRSIAALQTETSAADPAHALAALAELRSRAFASADPGLLEHINAPGSEALQADQDQVGRLVRDGHVLRGLEMQVSVLEPIAAAGTAGPAAIRLPDTSGRPETAELRVLLEVSGYAQTDSGGTVIHREEARHQEVRLVLLRLDGSWRISRVLPA